MMKIQVPLFLLLFLACKGGSGEPFGGDGGAPAPPLDAGQNICGLPLDGGNCAAFGLVFGFNAVTRKCERFVYGGCGGNANRFNTAGECLSTCLSRELPERACANVTCRDSEGEKCVFLGVEPTCGVSCEDDGPCTGGAGGAGGTCKCGGSCPGCEDCSKICAQ